MTAHGTNAASCANHAIPSVAAWRASVGFKHFPSPSWAHLLPPFPALERPLHLALPCIGLDGVSHGLAALSVPFQVDYDVDTLGCLRQPLATIHGAHAETFNLGPREGDMLLADVGSWDRVDAAVCGPPCQPDSSIGLRLHAADPRAAVLNKVTEIIADQGRKGGFLLHRRIGARRFCESQEEVD